MEIITAYRAWNRVQTLLSAPTPSSAFHFRHLSGYNITQPHHHTGEVCGLNACKYWTHHRSTSACDRKSMKPSFLLVTVTKICKSKLAAGLPIQAFTPVLTTTLIHSYLQCCRAYTQKTVYQGNGWTHRPGFKSCLLHYPYEQGHILSFFVPQIAYLMGL